MEPAPPAIFARRRLSWSLPPMVASRMKSRAACDCQAGKDLAYDLEKPRPDSGLPLPHCAAGSWLSEEGGSKRARLGDGDKSDSPESAADIPRAARMSAIQVERSKIEEFEYSQTNRGSSRSTATVTVRAVRRDPPISHLGRLFTADLARKFTSSASRNIHESNYHKHSKEPPACGGKCPAPPPAPLTAAGRRPESMETSTCFIGAGR